MVYRETHLVDARVAHCETHLVDARVAHRETHLVDARVATCKVRCDDKLMAESFLGVSLQYSRQFDWETIICDIFCAMPDDANCPIFDP